MTLRSSRAIFGAVLVLVVGVSLLPQPYAASAQSHSGSFCGPGSGLAETTVPDFWFTDACEIHDICYDRSGETRLTCDLIFLSAMLDACAGLAPWQKLTYVYIVCLSQAFYYFTIVRAAGGLFYEPLPPPTTTVDTTAPSNDCPTDDGSLCFDFALDSFSVDGNLGGSGDADGRLDLFDDFDDGLLESGPTAAFFFNQGPTATAERNGYLHLTSSDGWFELGGGIRDDILTNDRLVHGGGDAVIAAIFIASAPLPGQSYFLGIAGFEDESESVRISVQYGPGGPVVIADEFHTGRVLGRSPIDLSLSSRITLRIEILDPEGAVFISYRVGDEGPFTTFDEAGRIFAENEEIFAFVFAEAK